MIIKLKASKLFTKDPSERFAEEYDLPTTLWNEIWRRYKLLGYSVPELCEIFQIKSGKEIKQDTMRSWIFRGEVYMLTNDKVKMGVEAVNSNFFGKYESRVINEILHNAKYNNVKRPRGLA